MSYFESHSMMKKYNLKLFFILFFEFVSVDFTAEIIFFAINYSLVYCKHAFFICNFSITKFAFNNFIFARRWIFLQNVSSLYIHHYPKQV